MQLYLYGAGDIGRKVLNALRVTGLGNQSYESLSFIDNFISQEEVNGVPVCRFEFLLFNMKCNDIGIILCTSKPLLYYKWYEQVLSYGIPVYDITVEKGIYKSKRYPIISFLASQNEGNYEDGLIILEGCHVGKNVKIGKHVLLDSNCWIGDNVILEDGVKVWGNAKLHDGCKIGEGSCICERVEIFPNVKIGCKSFVCASAKVHLNIMEESWYPG